MHRPWRFAVPLILVACVAVAAPPVDVRSGPETRKPVSADPFVNPNAPPTTGLPPAASHGKRFAEEDEVGEGSWESAKWTQSTVNVHGSGSERIGVAAP